MGQRSRKRRRAETAPAKPAAPAPPSGAARSRSEERNEAVRRSLEPLAPGERPLPVTIGAAVCAVLAVANGVLAVIGYDASGQAGGTVGGLVFTALLGAMAVGLWLGKYWAALGYQALLGITVLFAFLGLLVASNVLAVLLTVTVIAAAGFHFVKMIRAMARLQMPGRP